MSGRHESRRMFKSGQLNVDVLVVDADLIARQRHLRRTTQHSPVRAKVKRAEVPRTEKGPLPGDGTVDERSVAVRAYRPERKYFVTYQNDPNPRAIDGHNPWLELS